MSVLTLSRGYEEAAFEVQLSGLKFNRLLHLVQFILVSATKESVP